MDKGNMEQKFDGIFGTNVFNDTVMKERLPKATYRMLRKTIDEGLTLTPAVADIVANAIKDWALEKGATHYTHWFQPMTGITAEKHDSFLTPTEDGKVILEFSGKELIRGEPDASSFPSGGLRSTYEARGYTAWDCTSPAFIKKDETGVVLCIPTAFMAYTGEVLDKKTPLLRSMEALSKQAIRILRIFGNRTSKRVITTVGAEQEYFLIDKELYKQRKDLILTGRTLFGAYAPKGQEMGDHYFGSIKERVAGFMQELNSELWKLGITAKTQHNEVAPSQHELAPVFSTTNIATDHNQLTMEMMKKVANRHGMACLLHEKPFAGVNGSGKHNNWSLSTDDGQNLLDPGKTPHENAQFLIFLLAVIKGVDEYPELLRLSAANSGNDHRLGANEAPPAIISIFLGDQLTDLIHQIEQGSLTNSKQGGILQVGVTTLPALPKDNTDRNRTSPFAFTGNKFEFRMVPSSISIACPNYILNTIIAQSLKEIADELEGVADLNPKLQEIFRDIIKKHGRIIFNGNNYSEKWMTEAKQRGLPNIPSTAEAMPYLISERSVKLFENHDVLKRNELESRCEINLEIYNKTINIEALTSLMMAKRQILPAVIKFTTQLADSINAVKTASVQANASVQAGLLNQVSNTLVSFQQKIEHLETVTKEAAAMRGDTIKQAEFYRDEVFLAMNALREDADHLETLVDADLWPFPTYTELLFSI